MNFPFTYVAVEEMRAAFSSFGISEGDVYVEEWHKGGGLIKLHCGGIRGFGLPLSKKSERLCNEIWGHEKLYYDPRSCNPFPLGARIGGLELLLPQSSTFTEALTQSLIESTF